MVVYGLGESEISELKDLIVNEYIFRFYISMHQMSIVEHLVALGYLSDDLPYFLFGHQGHLFDILIE